MHALDHVPPPVATLFAFVFAGVFFWMARDPQRARGSEQRQADYRRRFPLQAALFGDMSNRALRNFALIVGAGFVVIGVLGLFI